MKGKRLKEMCHWMGSYFHDCAIMALHFQYSYYNGVAHFQDVRGKKSSGKEGFKNGNICS